MELMEDFGFVHGRYTVIDSYPNIQTDSPVFPLITVGSPYRSSVPVQLSSRPCIEIRVAIDVFANSEAQKSDIVDLLQENIVDKYLTVYNFSTGFPSAVGVYTGISNYGKMLVKGFSSVDMPSSKFEKIEQEKYHEMIIITIQLPINSL